MAGREPSSHFTREVDMYQPLLALFVQTATCWAEVPFFGKRIDLLFASHTLRSLYAVETKLQDWRSAFKQAAINQLAAQRSYIAVPRPLALRLLNRDQDLFLRYDVGLIAVGKTASVLVPARKNGCFSPRYYQVLKQTLSRARSRKPQRLGVVTDAIASRARAMVILQTRTH